MSFEIEGGIVRLSGHCGAEDAEALLAALAGGAEQVDLGGCEHLHGALVQLLMASGVPVTGNPSGFVGRWIGPVLGMPMREPG